MKKTFICSLIYKGGIIGGALYLDDTAITYKTNKLTVDRKHRNLMLPLDDIREISWKWIIFPIATLKMASGEEYKLIIFNKKRFNKYYSEVKTV